MQISPGVMALPSGPRRTEVRWVSAVRATKPWVSDRRPSANLVPGEGFMPWIIAADYAGARAGTVPAEACMEQDFIAVKGSRRWCVKG
jgi:hypothetical protein